MNSPSKEFFRCRVISKKGNESVIHSVLFEKIVREALKKNSKYFKKTFMKVRPVQIQFIGALDIK